MSKTLYRDPRQGRLGGVCAGLADYLGFEVWVVRLVAVIALLFGWGVTFLLYMVAWFMLEKRPADLPSQQGSGIKQHTWQQGNSPQTALDEASRRLAEMERRLQQMERCVTSSAYRVRRELRGL